MGAALIVRNIARHLDTHFRGKPRDYRPLVYCWRGGHRSRSLAIVLREIGWKVTVLTGGYRAYRQHVRHHLDEVCQQARFHVISGFTGAGKTRLLEWLAQHGTNVLNLEALAAHRGSLLGAEAALQPTQKYFESLLWDALSRCDLSREIFIEAESKRIGRLFCPEPLWCAMVRAPVTRITVLLEARVDFLLREYAHFIEAPDRLLEKLPVLIGQQSRAQVNQWQGMIRDGRWREFVASILENHYDPAYTAFPEFRGRVNVVALPSIDEDAWQSAARQLIQASSGDPITLKKVADPVRTRATGPFGREDVRSA
jgi:tRNA 2-selenouridine synthase